MVCPITQGDHNNNKNNPTYRVPVCQNTSVTFADMKKSQTDWDCVKVLRPT